MTSLCNAKCPMCARTMQGGKTNRHLPLTELTIDDIQKIFYPNFVKQLNLIYLCGNYGDPILARDLMRSLTYFKSQNPQIKIHIHTNGSVRSPDWWRTLAQVCDIVYFGIDGLRDTNPLYRIGTDFDQIIDNATAYIQNGGYAKWQFIVFRHNEHQVEEARKLAHQIGFQEFNIKKTGRFFSNTQLQAKEQMEVSNSSGEITHVLEKPLRTEWQNQSLNKEAALIEKYGHLKNYIEKTSITCQAAEEKSLYVSAEGLVFPCCWTANQLYVWYQEAESNEIWRLIKQLPEGKKSLSALHRPLEEILCGDFFNRLIPESWKASSMKEGRLWVCGKTCGKEFQPFKHQFEEPNRLQLSSASLSS